MNTNYRILKFNKDGSFKIKFANTDSPSWLTLDNARLLCDKNNDEKIYEFIPGGDRLWEVM